MHGHAPAIRLRRSSEAHRGSCCGCVATGTPPPFGHPLSRPPARQVEMNNALDPNKSLPERLEHTLTELTTIYDAIEADVLLAEEQVIIHDSPLGLPVQLPVQPWGTFHRRT